MSFERVEAILRKLWGGTTDMEKGVFERTPNRQDARFHPNACVAMQVPVKITIRDSSGNSETCTARTLLVNRRGVRFESLPPLNKPGNQHSFKLNEILWIEVPSTGKASEARVVWTDQRCNLRGHFEFTAELERARELFAAPSSNELDSPRTPQTSPGFPSLSLSLGSLIAEAAEEPSLSPHNLSPGPDAASSRPSDPTNEIEGGTMNMTDRLAEALQEVVESAVHKEEEAASERLVREVKDRMGQTRQAAFEDLRQEMTEQAAVLEDQLLQQCRARTEQMLSTTLETALHALSEQMDELAEKTEERVRKIFDGLAEQLEQRSAKALAETTSRIEEQAEKAAKDFHGTIAQNVLLELAENQKVMVGQMQQQIGMVTEQNLIRLRGGLTRTLQELAEASQNGKFAL
ncbi:MAG: hypothetical protein ACRD88_18590 [Terriglobia bacterium]